MGVALLVMGATGRIGAAMRHQPATPGLRPIWQARRPESGFLNWDILTEPCPIGAASGVVLCLAGVIHGDDVALNEALALAACRAAIGQGARHVFLTSSAAVYGRSHNSLGEDALPAPSSPYGAAKARMEQAAQAMMPADGPGLTILRIGNIAGFDALLGGLKSGIPARLDPVAGQAGGPVRSYIGPMSLARVLTRLAGLAAKHVALPPVLNIAAAPVSMGDLLDAAGADWNYGGQNPNVIPRVELDTALMKTLIHLPPRASEPAVMVAEWRGLT